jgi:hypothetical protein
MLVSGGVREESPMVNAPAPPGAEDDDAYVYFDHRALESEIVEAVSLRLAPEHALIPREVHGGEELYVTYRGVEHKLPLTVTPHDRYVAISSIAELLKDHYRFFALLPSHDTDTHAVLVVPVAVAQGWSSLPEHLEPLRLGFDYFHGLDVPYLNHETSAPNFARESEAARAGTDAFSQYLVSSVFFGKSDPAAAAALAKAAMMDPKVREHSQFPTGMSEAEVAAEIHKAMEEALQRPEMKESQDKISAAWTDLRTFMQSEVERVMRESGPKKPWWKFW